MIMRRRGKDGRVDRVDRGGQTGQRSSRPWPADDRARPRPCEMAYWEQPEMADAEAAPCNSLWTPPAKESQEAGPRALAHLPPFIGTGRTVASPSGCPVFFVPAVLVKRVRAVLTGIIIPGGLGTHQARYPSSRCRLHAQVCKSTPRDARVQAV